MADITEDEDASELMLGEDFATARCLSNAEVLVYLEQSKKLNEAADKPFTDVFQESYSYTKRFSDGDGVSNQAAIKSLREALEAKRFQIEMDMGQTKTTSLRQFEVAALLNLGVEDTEEAYALIPSLQRVMKKDDLQEVLDMIAKAKERTTFT